jgi:hypothetical protein
MAAEFVLNRAIRVGAHRGEIELDRARSLLEDAEAVRVQLDEEGLGYAVERAIERLANMAARAAAATSRARAVGRHGDLIEALPFDVNLWKTQNVFYELLNARCTLP